METKLNCKGKRFFALALTASLMLATAFTLNACGGDGGGSGDDTPASSSSGNGSLSLTSSSSGSGSSPSSSSQPSPKCGEYKHDEEFCDERDEKLYKYVEINGQTWMAENLNFDADGSRCYGDDTGGDSEGNCAKYGRLYKWATAMDGAASSDANPSGVQGICPSGWHLPSSAEWVALAISAGGTGTNGNSGPAGTKLKAKSGWNAHATYGNGTDDFGFSALPGGEGYSNGNFSNFSYAGNSGNWWGTSELESPNNDTYHIQSMYYSSEVASHFWDGSIGKFGLLSVRCVQD